MYEIYLNNLLMVIQHYINIGIGLRNDSHQRYAVAYI